MTGRILLSAAVAALAAAIAIPAIALAAEGDVPHAVAQDGQHAYQNLCASCHGDSGKGDGPMAPELVNKPIDLTQIAKKNNGKFPFWHVYQTIDGRKIPRVHGGAEMPVWGSRSEMFLGQIPSREWMLAVTFYIQSIQEK